MIIDMNYWYKVLKKIIVFLFSVVGIYLTFKLSIFFMPFLIAFILSLFIEPIIRFCMKHLKLKRKGSTILVFIIVLTIIIGLLTWGIVSLISESSNFLRDLNSNVEKISTTINNMISKIDFEKIKIPNEFKNTIKSASTDILGGAAEWIKGLLTGVINVIGTLPTVGIYTVITIIALYFICVDKIYILDQIEHHFPELWVKKFMKHIKQIIKSLGAYIKAQAILVFVSFIVCLIGLYILKFVGMNVEFPLISALGIGFVDALPIFGSATAMIPWAIIVALNGDITLGVSLIVLLTVMGLVRQFFEPKVISGHIGIHPIFTLIAMYTGFKLLGIIGLLVGPIALIILKNVYGTMIDKGFAKAIFEREI